MRRLTTFLLVVGLALAAAPAWAQTGVLLAPPLGPWLDNNGTPLDGGKVYTYAAGTTTLQATYSSSTLTVPNQNTNPVILDSAGRWPIYLDPTLSYKITVQTSAGVTLYTQDNIVGPYSGVFSVTTASTRGIQISRTSAEAGLSIASSGGSGKTYGLASKTDGSFVLQDDADGTPNWKISGNDSTFTQTGGFNVPSGTATFGGFGTHLFSASGTGVNSLAVRNQTAGTGNYADFILANDASAAALRITQTSTTYTASGAYPQDGAVINAFRSGGLSIATTSAAGDIRLYTGSTPSERMRIDETGRVIIGTTSSGLDLELRSTADDLSGGFKLSRGDANSTLMIVNVNDGGAGLAKGIIQAGDNSAYRPTAISPNGGGVEIGGGTAIISVVTGSTTYDPPSLTSTSATSTTVSVTGATSSSVCFAGHTTIGSTTFLTAVSPGTNQATVSFYNISGSTQDFASGTLRVTCFNY